MTNLLNAGKLLLLDLASTIVFSAVFVLTHDTYLAIGCGVALALAQIGIALVRRKPVETKEWLSLYLVIAAGAATLVTDDPRWVQFKPSLIYAIVGAVMLRPGWLNRYLPGIARAVVPDIAIGLGFAWAGLMFASAVTNAFIAVNFSLATWAVLMPAFGAVTKLLLFFAGFAAMRIIARRRLRGMSEPEREAVLASAG